MEVQHTIANPVTVSGRGLFTGEPVTMTLRPAEANHGVVFQRKDLNGAAVPALIQYVVKRARRTALRCGDAIVETCEHCLSALSATGIDNLIIELDAAELPALDGSSKPYVELLAKAGIKALDAPRARLVVTEPVVVRQDGAMVAAVPDDGPGMQIVYDLDFGQGGTIDRQMRAYNLTGTGAADDEYTEQIAPARTFVLESEAEALRSSGVGTHLTEQDVLVFGPDGPLGGNALRFADEPVRHKIVDLIGDLYLIGAPVQGRIIAHRSGHALNHALARRLVKQQQNRRRAGLSQQPAAIDIRQLMRMLPHRYPMLLVDRVLEVDSDRRAVGVKNVTINEPFFQGHYPGTPIMPGVLVVEAMAQLSGVLIGQKLEHTGKLAVLLSLDRVKLRKPVTPGDCLMLEAEAVRIRRRVAHMRCRAYTGEDLAAEAEVKFMLVDDDQGVEGVS